MEDPTPAENQEALRLIRSHTTTPIAIGEVFNTIHDCRALIENQLIDYVRTTVVHTGGISHLRKIAALAELYQVRTGSHGATDLSPVCMGAGAAFRCCGAKFRHPGIHAAHAGNRCGFSTSLQLRGRFPFILAKRQATASTSTRERQRVSLTSAPICRLLTSKTARCGIGERRDAA